MSRRVSQAPVSVEALLPSLGALSVNRATPPKQAPIAAGEKKRQKKGGEGDGDDAETGPRLGLLPTDPGTGQPVKWEKEDGKLDEDALKRLVFAQNKEWVRYYPPPGELKKPEEYGFKDWTSFFPENDNLQISNPHWLRAAPSNPIWPASKEKHPTLADARQSFVAILQDSLKELVQTKKTSAAELQAAIDDRKESLKTLNIIMENDANKTDPKELESSRAVIAKMLRKDEVFGQYKRTRQPFPLPPGWMTMYKHRTVSSMENQLKTKKGTKQEGKPGAFSDPSYVGPQYASWSVQDPGSKQYRAHLQDSPVQAWLVYLLYQTSSKTFDPREEGRRKGATEEAKRIAAENAARRKKQAAEREVKFEQERVQKKKAIEEERDAALAEAGEASRRAAQSDMQEEEDPLAALDEEGEADGDKAADAPVPPEAGGEGGDGGETDGDEELRLLEQLIA